MDHKERMLRHLPYQAWKDGLCEERLACQKKLYAYNHLPPERWEEEQADLLREILGKTGERIGIIPPFHCDYGYNIEVGENFFANYHLVILDVGKVTIGSNVLIAPNVGIYAAAHPVHPEPRDAGWEHGADITIGNSVWIGGGVSILPGVRIGNNVVIGAGSVVTANLPDNVIAVGNPCRVIREITDEDRERYCKHLEQL